MVFHRCSIVCQEIAFTITDTKHYIPFVTLPTQDNVKLLRQLKSSFKRTINWNEHHPKVTVWQQSQMLSYHLKINVVKHATQDIIFH